MSDTTETETDTNTNTDEPSKAELHERVQQLESTVEKLMPSRRDALKLGAAGIAGAAGVAGASGSAAASTGSAGQIGDSSNRPDVFADTVDANQLSGVSTGGVYQEDSNSPFQANGSDIDAQLSQTYNHVIGLIQADGTGVSNFNRLGMTVNGGGGPFHNYRQHDGTSVNDTNINLGKISGVGGRFTLTSRQRGFLGFSSQLASTQNNANFAEYGQIGFADISSIQLFDRNTNTNDIGLQLRVFFA